MGNIYIRVHNWGNHIYLRVCVFTWFFVISFGRIKLCGTKQALLDHWRLKCVTSLVDPGQKLECWPRVGRKQSFSQNLSYWHRPTRMITGCNAKWSRIVWVVQQRVMQPKIPNILTKTKTQTQFCVFIIFSHMLRVS